MRHTVFSLLLAIFAFTAIPSTTYAASASKTVTTTASSDSADKALEKALADLRNDEDTSDEDTSDDVTGNDRHVQTPIDELRSGVMDGLDDIDTDETEIVAVLFILGIFFMPFLAIIGVVWVICAYRANERRQRYSLVSKAIDCNYPLPPAVFERNMRSPLRQSSYLLALGLAVIIFFICVGAWKIGIAIGCVPILIGAAKLTAYRLEKEDRQ